MATPTLRTLSGIDVPVIGFGTYKCNGFEGVESIKNALDGGYSLLDSAVNYENEGAVGAATRHGSRRREDVLVVSKLPGRHQEHNAAVRTVEESLLRTGLDYLDLYLIHWPNPSRGMFVQAWQALIEARERGLIRSIGVCNFLLEHIDTLARETGIYPDINQVELHPYFPQVELLSYHEQHGILTQAWSPLYRGGALLDEAPIAAAAQAHGVSAAQVVLAWDMARGVIPIPKASGAERQREDLQSVNVVLSDAEVEAITSLGRSDGRMKAQDPAHYEEF